MNSACSKYLVINILATEYLPLVLLIMPAANHTVCALSYLPWLWKMSKAVSYTHSSKPVPLLPLKALYWLSQAVMFSFEWRSMVSVEYNSGTIWYFSFIQALDHYLFPHSPSHIMLLHITELLPEVSSFYYLLLIFMLTQQISTILQWYFSQTHLNEHIKN